MYISDERCIACGSRRRPTDLDTSASPEGNLGADGTFWEMPHWWFCSVECYKKTVAKYVKDHRFGFDTTPSDWEEFSAAFDDAYAEWVAVMSGGFISAMLKYRTMHDRDEFIESKVGHIRDRFYSIQKTEIYLAEVEVHERLHAEWMHQIRENDEKIEEKKAKLVERMEKEEEKQRIAQEKEDERQRKIDEEEEAREAEEERWRPRTFDL